MGRCLSFWTRSLSFSTRSHRNRNVAACWSATTQLPPPTRVVLRPYSGSPLTRVIPSVCAASGAPSSIPHRRCLQGSKCGAPSPQTHRSFLTSVLQSPLERGHLARCGPSERSDGPRIAVAVAARSSHLRSQRNGHHILFLQGWRWSLNGVG